MTEKRHMVEGVQLDSGITTDGYYAFIPASELCEYDRHFIYRVSEDDPDILVRVLVDPTTVEPVAAEVVPLDTNNKFRKKYQCPSCNGLLVFDCIEYCHGCGQRLDWTKAVSEEGKV